MEEPDQAVPIKGVHTCMHLHNFSTLLLTPTTSSVELYRS